MKVRRLSQLSQRVACAGALVLGCSLCTAPSAAAPPDADIDAARDLAGRDPRAARGALDAIRAQSKARNDLARRLAADEAECRLLSDIDPALARDVAESGAAAASKAADMPARLAALRLAACGAGALLDMGRTAAGNIELDRLIDEAGRSDLLSAAGAMAKLERGLHRSRRGELVSGQDDLLAACTLLEELALHRDLELCHSHLANHYKRTGDTDEALRLLENLLDRARQRQASADVDVYIYALAQVRLERGEWELALHGFEESRSIAKSTGDVAGEAYAEHGTAFTLLRMDRPADALPHVERELALLAGGSDALQITRATLLRAMLHNELQRPAEALKELLNRQAAMEEVHDDMLSAEWMLARSRAESRLGHWREAFESGEAARVIQARLQKQRLSEQSGRLRMQFNRQKDEAELRALRQVNEQGVRLQRTQALALGLFVVLLSLAVWFAGRKIGQARRMHKLAMVDELTGLPNRRAVLARLEDQLRMASRLARPLSVLLIDVDHFKSVNDTHGHAVGDEVLRHLSRVLAGSLRAHDWIGRLGGEEFLAVLPDASPEHTHTIAERMRQSIAAAPCITANGPLPLTVSIGVATLLDMRESSERIVERADEALYAAKNSGRNRVWVAQAAAAAAAS